MRIIIVIVLSVICFLLITMAIYNLRDKVNYLEDSLAELEYTVSGLIHEISHMSDKLK